MTRRGVGVRPRAAAVLVALIALGGVRSAAAQRAGVATGISAGPVGALGGGADSVGPALSLEQAQEIARHNNPTFLESLVARRNTSAALRSAYGGLLPQLSASLGAQYQQGGNQIVSGINFGSPSNALASTYNLGLSYQVNAATILTPAYARANRDAADADIGSQGAALRSGVAQQYLTTLQAQAKAVLQDTLIVDAQAQLDLARARVAVGSATELDTHRAEVALGQQQVDALQARNQANVELLRLFQAMGIEQPAGVRLTTTFAVTAPTFTLDSMLALARLQNPDLIALRSRAHAANVGVHRARGLYAPTLSINTGIGGYTYQYTDVNALIAEDGEAAQETYGLCLAIAADQRAAIGFPADCSGIQLTPAQTAQLKASNKQFPFGFVNNPRQISAMLSLPLFDGFQREQTVEIASAAEDDAHYQVRARELQLTADVTAAYYTLTTAVQTAQLQTQNAAKAREELLFAEQRYQVGDASYLDVNDARAAYERAENDRISAVYEYHKAFAALESAVGRPLR